MNYLAEIKAFYDLVQVKQLSTGQIALWNALMYVNNKCTWIEWFTVPNLLLELNTGMSRSGVLKARNSLKQLGLIDFKANGTKATSYKINTIVKSTQESKQDGVQASMQVGKQVSKQISNTLNKLNENNKKEINKRKEKEFIAPTLEEVEKYVVEKKLSVNAKKFYEYFTEGNWIDSKGNPVKNWKQKILTWNGYGNKEIPKEPIKKTFQSYEQRNYADLDKIIEMKQGG